MNLPANRFTLLAVLTSFLSVLPAAQAQQRQPDSAAIQGFLYVAYSQNDPVVSMYSLSASGYAKPLYKIEGPQTGVRSPSAIAVAANGTTYVSNLPGYGGTASIVVFPTANGNVPAKAIITCSLTQPYGVALDARSIIHVGDAGPAAILTFRNNANGCVAPVSKISGQKTGLVTPLGIALDAQGRTLEADESGSVNVYGPGAAGDIAPSFRIAGSQTGLTGPRALGLDIQKNIFVTNMPPTGPPSVLEFAHNAKGNASPIRRITGAKTLLNGPRGIAVSKRTGEIFVADDLGVLVFAASAYGNVAPIRVVRSIEGSVAGVALRE